METGEYLGEYQYLYGRGDGQNAINIGAAALKFRDYLDDKENVDSYVLGGRSGIVFIRAYYDESDGYVYMDCAYDLKVDVPLFGSVNIPVTESLRQKAYVGRLVDEEAGNEQDPYVYIAEMVRYAISQDTVHILSCLSGKPHWSLLRGHTLPVNCVLREVEAGRQCM